MEVTVLQTGKLITSHLINVKPEEKAQDIMKRVVKHIEARAPKVLELATEYGRMFGEFLIFQLVESDDEEFNKLKEGCREQLFQCLLADIPPEVKGDLIEGLRTIIQNELYEDEEGEGEGNDGDEGEIESDIDEGYEIAPVETQEKTVER